MNSFLQNLYSTTAHRQPREALRDLVLQDRVLIDSLVDVAFDIQNKFHFKACWILELVCIDHLELLSPYLERFCEAMPKYVHDSAIRPIAKITFLLVKENFSKNPKVKLTEFQIHKITETCFDWLISDQKVAAKAYSAEALYVLGKHQDWIYPELIQILSDGYNHHSAAYKATARKIIGYLK